MNLLAVRFGPQKRGTFLSISKLRFGAGVGVFFPRDPRDEYCSGESQQSKQKESMLTDKYCAFFCCCIAILCRWQTKPHSFNLKFLISTNNQYSTPREGCEGKKMRILCKYNFLYFFLQSTGINTNRLIKQCYNLFYNILI